MYAYIGKAIRELKLLGGIVGILFSVIMYRMVLLLN
jgi:hypothetical protein